MERTEKQELVVSLKEVFSSASVVVVTHYSGLNVSEMTKLRNRVREAGASFRVTQNKLTRLALDGSGYQPLESYFDGPTAIGYSDDPVAAPKALVKFAKENEKLVVLGGMMGADRLDVEDIELLAGLPSLDELRAILAGLISRPATMTVQVLQAPAGQLARVISAYGAMDAA
ncbi:MAG: 50S ribosomal protein L10 [Alphaproteobacteria bacterium]|nr:50S ribosomal protein L10 [Alphaproteobacteria bacterium]